ncbi:hypothetical protein CXIVA_09670 [Clostridium sp. SY8519]|jgi:hypothetical protein|nr:hypothetical protein CXIVA_09670 [Clostridium sp. SY8519]
MRSSPNSVWASRDRLIHTFIHKTVHLSTYVTKNQERWNVSVLEKRKVNGGKSGKPKNALTEEGNNHACTRRKL